MSYRPTRPLVTGTMNVSEYEGTRLYRAIVIAWSPSVDDSSVRDVVARVTTCVAQTLIANTFVAVTAFENVAFPVMYRPSVVKRFE
jgi:hypothetical protein